MSKMKKPLAHYDSELNIAYSDASILNTVDVYFPRQNAGPEASQTGYWVIFIHGGGWRDPRETSKAIEPALHHLPPAEYHVAGVAAMNYRLSEHDQFPSEPGSPDRKARSATHPTHIQDVLQAIDWLQHRYGFAGRYILAGHSAGATMAFQAAMDVWTPGGPESKSFTPPTAIVGVCGIYDLQLFLKTHAEIPIYRRFLEAAFGTNQDQWAAASPVTGKFRETWPNGKAVVVAPSKDDELVDFIQAETLSEHLWKEKKEGRRDVVISLSGSHEEVWANGVELAKAIKKGLELLS